MDEQTSKEESGEEDNLHDKLKKKSGKSKPKSKKVQQSKTLESNESDVDETNLKGKKRYLLRK